MLGRCELLSQLPVRFVQGQEPTRFALPYDAFAHSRSDAKITLSAVLSNGDRLPEWVVFDRNSGTFQVTPPKAFKGNLQIKVIARDSEGREVSTMFQMYLGEDRNNKPQSRSGLSEQLRMGQFRHAPFERMAQTQREQRWRG